MAFPRIPKVTLERGITLFPIMFIHIHYCFAPGAAAAHFSQCLARFPRVSNARGHIQLTVLQLR
jgi:hypothetical protein